MTPTTFWNTVEINRNHYGNAYVYMRKKFDRKKYGGEIKIVDLWVMQSNCVQIVVDDAGIFAGVGRLWYVYTDPTSGRQYVFSTDEVMHFKTSFSFDGITGLPVQQILRDTVAGASESQAFMNTLTNCGDTLRIAAASVGNIRPIFILFPPVGGSLGLFIPSTSFPAMYTVLMLFTLKIIENLLTIHALSSRCDRCHVSHGIAERCLSACHRQSVGCHPDTDGATAAPFRL